MRCPRSNQEHVARRLHDALALDHALALMPLDFDETLAGVDFTGDLKPALCRASTSPALAAGLRTSVRARSQPPGRAVSQAGMPDLPGTRRLEICTAGSSLRARSITSTIAAGGVSCAQLSPRPAIIFAQTTTSLIWSKTRQWQTGAHRRPAAADLSFRGQGRCASITSMPGARSMPTPAGCRPTVSVLDRYALKDIAFKVSVSAASARSARSAVHVPRDGTPLF